MGLFQQTLPVSLTDGVTPIPGPQLVVDVCQVVFHGLFCNEQLVGNVAGGFSGGDQT